MVSANGSPFLDHVVPPDASGSASWLGDLRRRGLERFREVGFPGPREEAWRFTRLRSLEKVGFVRPGPAPPGDLDVGEVSLLRSLTHRMVFVNGVHDPELSSPDTGSEVKMESLRQLRDSGGEVSPELGRHVDLNRHRFGALNTALLDDGAVIRVASGARLKKPVHLLFVSRPGPEPTASYPRVLLIAEEGSEVTLLQEHVGDPESTYFTGAVTEIVVRANASVQHIQLEREGPRAFHIGTVAADLDRDGRLVSHALSLGGKLVRSDIDARLRGEGSQCRLYGLYLAGGRQHVDHHTRIEHAVPHTTSHEHYKGVLDDRATGVFNGRVVIRPQAQKVEARQTNNNLLLSKDALVNTNPELEIFADDVKAQHGATVGQLDEEHLFYLRSRGLDEQLARRVLIQAFAGEMIEHVPHPELRGKLSASVNERF